MFFKKMISFILLVCFCLNSINYIAFAQELEFEDTYISENLVTEETQVEENKVQSEVIQNKSDSGLTIDARGAVLVEPRTGQILIEQNKDAKHPLASVTKVMTLVLIYDAIAREQIKWDDVVTTSLHASSMGGSQVFLEEHEQQTVDTLTKCISIASANDASVAMAEFIGGSEEGFVKMMNDKAKELGMNNTNFVNACGLDAPDHYSTAYDIALMSMYLMNNYPDVSKYATTWQDTIIHKTAKGEQEFGLSNTNKLVKSYNGATGLKTGSTSDALYCVSASATRDDMNLIAVILGAPDPTTRFAEAKKLLDYGFFNYVTAKGEPKDKEMGEVTIYKGEKNSVPVVIGEDCTLVVGKGNNRQLESKVEILSSLNAPVEKGTKAGEVIYSFEGKEVGRVSLVTKDGIDRASLKDTMTRLLIKWI